MTTMLMKLMVLQQVQARSSQWALHFPRDLCIIMYQIVLYCAHIRVRCSGNLPRGILVSKNTTTTRISLFGTNAIYHTQTSTRYAVRLASTQAQRPLLLRHHGDTVASTIDMAKPNSRARYMPQHLSSRRAAPYRAHW
jgi:hypothetical protein